MMTLKRAVRAVTEALAPLPDLGAPGARPGQTIADSVADEAAVAVLLEDGLGVLSEESGIHGPQGGLVVVVDPLDGSDNATHGLPLCATSLCAFDGAGPVAAIVQRIGGEQTYEATRDQGAFRNGTRVVPSTCERLDIAFVALSGHPRRRPGQAARSLGVASLALCGVADGTFDAFVDVDDDHHRLWDVAAGLFVCLEAGAATGDALGRDLWPAGLAERRTPIAAASAPLLRECLSYSARERDLDRLG